ncbi:Type I secretion membrane fusion protein, HlyD family [Sphingomonas paucimobilis]|uniref:HlyD family type I secretion periplasmic adaptor subunit n=1 Tax=Sphingobium TaxID=165695 RepID=UPI000410F203|nr:MULTISPECIES: HlyD family type I secretion periplasmic adaptor subunit [Sphingobium]EZP71972.1 Type I secretion membrane fusion protein, HlyD family [Sphingomonas paucimobilis]
MKLVKFFPERRLLLAGGGEITAGERVDPQVFPIMRAAYRAIALFIAIFALWAFLAPMNSAAIAPGILRAEGGGRKVIQHLEGGIIARILVRDGQHVRAGQPLVLLDGTQAGARDAALQASYDSLLAQDARLSAEREGRSAVVYPAELLSRKDEPGVAQILASSNSVFNTRRTAMNAQINILQQRVGQGGSEISSYMAQVSALGEQQKLLAQENEGVKALVNEGLERRSRQLALQRQESATAGQRGQLMGNISRAQQSISETRAQMAFLRNQQLSEVAAQQREVQNALADVREKLAASKDISRRQQIVAPVEGTVVNLRKVTLGGVVGPGEPILDLVPTNAKIVIMARLKALDIDVVHEGLRAEVRLTPYKARILPMLRGQVRNVSADATLDQATGALYYEAEVVLDEKELKDLADVQLLSGMPAEVYINLGARSLFQYLVQPVIDSFHRAMREQ